MQIILIIIGFLQFIYRKLTIRKQSISLIKILKEAEVLKEMLDFQQLGGIGYTHYLKRILVLEVMSSFHNFPVGCDINQAKSWLI